MVKKPRRIKPTRLEAILDSIKNEIDTLHDIKHEKQRYEAARELVDYLELYFETP
jgi:hypothetical protein